MFCLLCGFAPLWLFLVFYCNTPNADVHAADAVVLEPQPQSALERSRCLHAQPHAILEGATGRHGDLLMVLRTEAAVDPSPLGQADDPPGHLGRVGDRQHEVVLADGAVRPVDLFGRDGEVRVLHRWLTLQPIRYPARNQAPHSNQCKQPGEQFHGE